MKNNLIYAILALLVTAIWLPVRVSNLQSGTVIINATPTAFVTIRSDNFFDSGKTPFQRTLDYGSYSAVVMLAGYIPKFIDINVERSSVNIQVDLVENLDWRRLTSIPIGTSVEFVNIQSISGLPIVKVGNDEAQMYALAGGDNPTATETDITLQTLALSPTTLKKYNVAMWQALGVEPQIKVYISPLNRYMIAPRWTSEEQKVANLWLIDLQNETELMLPQTVVGSVEQLTNDRIIWAKDGNGFITDLFADEQPRLFRISKSSLKISATELLPIVKSEQKDSLSIQVLATTPDMNRILVTTSVPGPAFKIALIDVTKSDVKVLPNPDWLLTAACWISNNDVLLTQPNYGILKINYQTLNIDTLVSSADFGGATVYDARFSTDCADLFVIRDANLSDGSVLSLHIPSARSQ